jgi:hypothetical protein
MPFDACPLTPLLLIETCGGGALALRMAFRYNTPCSMIIPCGATHNERLTVAGVL